MKQIQLDVEGLFALVDDEDYDWLSQWEWRFTKSVRNHSGYAARSEHSKTIFMHRELMKAQTGTWVDHRDHNGLNDQRYNLRLATPTQNCRHTRKVAGRTSQFKGVYRHGATTAYKKPWGTTLTIKDKSLTLGSYDDEHIAALMSDFWTTYLFGDFASTNFNVIATSEKPLGGSNGRVPINQSDTVVDGVLMAGGGHIPVQTTEG